MSVAAVRRVVSRLEPERPPTDADLVAAIAPACADREGAFAELVARYGSMVLGVCRRVLADAHDAEDAFQAVFLVLARKAKAIRPPGAVGGWLYGVAVRTARKAKTAAARRRRREMIATVRAKPDRKAGSEPEQTGDELHRAELRAVIDAELAALPEMQRAAVVLCDLHGKTRAEAAAELKRPEGTVAAWLARGRKALAARLARRGVVLPAAGLVAVAAPSAVAAKLATSTVATFLGRGASAAVLSLAEGVMRSLSSTAKLGAVLAAAGVLLVAVATATAWQPRGEAKPDAGPATTPVAAPVPKPEPDVKAFLDHKGYVYSVSYAPNGKTFLSVGNGTATVWDTETLKKLFTADAEFASFSDDGKSLYLFTKDDFLVADAATGKARQKLARGAPEGSAGGRWATASGDGSARVEFDGDRHHLTSYPVKGAVPQLADQKELTFGTLVPNHGTGGAFAPGSIKLFAGIHRATTDFKETACLSIWSLPEGKRVGTIFRDANHPVQAFAWSPDGTEIAVAYADSVRVHDAKTLKELRKFDMNYGTAVAWSKDGKTLALGRANWQYQEDGLPADLIGKVVTRIKIDVSLLDAQTGKELRRFDGFSDNLPIVSLAFRPDGKHLLCGAGFFPGDGPASNVPQPVKDAASLRLIPVDAKADPKPEAAPGPVAWKETKVLTLPGWLAGSVAYSPDGKAFFVGGTSGFVRAYDAATLKQLWEHQEPTNFAAVAVTPDGKTLAVTFKDADRRWGIRLLSAATGKQELTVDEGGVPGVVGGAEPVAVAFFPDELLPGSEGQPPPTRRKVIFGTAAGYVVKTWTDPEKASTVKSNTVGAGKQPADSYAAPLAVDPNGKWAVVNGPPDKDTGKNVLWAWSANSGDEKKVLDGHKRTVVSAAWSKNGKVIATGDADGTVIVWDAATFKEKSRLKLGGRVAGVAVSPDGFGVAAAVVHSAPGENTAGNVFVWPAGAPPEKPEPLSSQLTGTPFTGLASLAFSPDGKQLVSCFANKTLLTRSGILVGHVRVFAVVPVPPTVPEKEKAAPVAKTVSHVEYAPDGKKYLAVSEGKATVYDAATGKRLYFFDAEAARFAAAGKKLFAMGEQILECDAETGKVVKTYNRPKTKTAWQQVVFAPDGKRFAAYFSAHIGVYETASGKEVATFATQLADAKVFVGGWLGGFSPDGKLFAALGVVVTQDGALGAAVWEVEPGKRLRAFGGTADAPLTVAFSSNGEEIAVGFKDRVEMCPTSPDAKYDPKVVKTEDPVTAIAYSADGKQLAIGIRARSYHRWWADVREAYKGEVLVVNAVSGQKIRRLGDFKRDSVLILDGKIKEPTPDDFRGSDGYWLDPFATALAFAPDGKTLLAGTGFPAMTRVPAGITKGGELKTFDLTAPEKPAAPVGRQWTDAAVLTDHGRLVNGVAVAPDGKAFAAAHEGGVTCWDAATRKVLWRYKPKDSALALAYSRDGKHLCVAGEIDVTRLDAKTGKNDPWTDNNSIQFGKMNALAYHPTDDRLAASDGYRTRVQYLSDARRDVTLGTAPKDNDPARSGRVAWSKDGKLLASIYHEKVKEKWPVVLWDTKPSGEMKFLSGHAEPVTALTWSEDGKLIATGDEKGTVIAWSAETGKELWRRKFRGRDDTDGRINALAISPADHTVAAAVSMGSGKGPERVVLLAGTDGKDGEHLMRWSIPVSSLVWSKDGAFLVTGCGAAGQSIKQSEPATGEVVVWERQKP